MGAVKLELDSGELEEQNRKESMLNKGYGFEYTDKNRNSSLSKSFNEKSTRANSRLTSEGSWTVNPYPDSVDFVYDTKLNKESFANDEELEMSNLKFSKAIREDI